MPRLMAKNGELTMKDFRKRYGISIITGAVLILIFAALAAAARTGGEEDSQGIYRYYTTYATGRVEEILSDSSEPEPLYENNPVGTQILLVKLTSGDFEGLSVGATNNLSALYGTRMNTGDRVVLAIYMSDGEIGSVNVYAYDRIIPIVIIAVIFAAVIVLVGGRRGAQSLIALVLTVAALFTVLIPLLVKGWNTIAATFIICILVAALSYVIIGGVSKKTACAMTGTALGLAFAVLFGLLSQSLLRIDGMRMGEYIDSLLQMKLGGMQLGLKGLLIAGMLISALGAVMDVAMSISSALSELVSVDPKLSRREIFRSGMNIGRDMIGTMTNTLILAFVGSSLVLVIYIFTQDYPMHELISADLIAVQIVHSISSSIGVVLSVPLTVFICALIYKRESK